MVVIGVAPFATEVERTACQPPPEGERWAHMIGAGIARPGTGHAKREGGALSDPPSLPPTPPIRSGARAAPTAQGERRETRQRQPERLEAAGRAAAALREAHRRGHRLRA